MTGSNITPFDFEGASVRVIDRDGEPWFVLNDVCFVLEIANPWNAAARLDDDEKGLHTTETPEGAQEKTIINESGLYSLIATDRRAATEGTTLYRFRKWARSEVVSAFRARGARGGDLVALTDGGDVTMSSREIAVVCDKEHRHVTRDIEKMLSDLGRDASKFGHTYRDAANREQKEYRLPKDLTLTLVTGYRADLRFKIIKRVEELEAEKRAREEAEQQPREAALPDLNDPEVLRPLLMNYAERTKIAEAKVEELAPKAQALDRFEGAVGSKCLRDAASILQIQEKELKRIMTEINWTYRRTGVGRLLAYGEKRKAGYLHHRTYTFFDEAINDNRNVAQLMITPKGMAYLARLLAKRNDAA